jgi:hypothetical protein
MHSVGLLHGCVFLHFLTAGCVGMVPIQLWTCRPINKLNTAVKSINAKSADPAYTSTKYAEFAGKVRILSTTVLTMVRQTQSSRPSFALVCKRPTRCFVQWLLPPQTIVPVFMAEFLDEKQRSRILDQCRRMGVRVGARTGNNISISARITQAAKPACSMRLRMLV